MLGDGVGNVCRNSLQQGIFAPHDPLYFRELPHHAGNEIGFAEVGNLLDLIADGRIEETGQ